jgi:trigger factor
MNIVREDRENKTAVIKVTVSESDYTQAVDKQLKEYKRKANMPGFRPGMVPMGIINKLYRKSAVAEEAYKAASQACFDYIDKEKIDYVGDVIPSEEQGTMDFDNDKEFEFIFEIGIAPEVAIDLAKEKITKYTIKPDKKMYEGYRSNFVRRFGTLVDVDKVEKDEALTVTLDNEAMNVADAYVGLISMTEEERKPFIGKKVGDVMDVDINELYKTPSQRAAILKVKEDELEGINPKFTMTINQIRKFAEPELNDEFYKMAFPDGSVTDEKGFETYIYEQIARDLARETESMFAYTVRKQLVEKAGLEMPEAFLRRWLFVINEGKFTMEQIEADFPQFLEMMKWNLIQKHYAKTLELKVEVADAMAEAKAIAAMQFAQYGMMQVPDDMLDGYAKQMLSNKDEANKIYDKIYEHKVIEAVTPMMAMTDKEVSADEFNKIAEKLMK